MAATSHGKMHMYELFCVLCAAKLDDKASRINVRGRSSFPVWNWVKEAAAKACNRWQHSFVFSLSSQAKEEKVLRGKFSRCIGRDYSKLWKRYETHGLCAFVYQHTYEIGANIGRWTYHLYFFSSTHIFATSANTSTQKRHWTWCHGRLFVFFVIFLLFLLRTFISLYEKHAYVVSLFILLNWN